jgi:sugar lactone lactonase YvrE
VVPATQAPLSNVTALAVDSNGNLYFAENSRLRGIDARGMLITVAGNGSATPKAGAAANAVRFGATPEGLAFSPAGRLTFTDPYMRVVRALSADQSVLANVAGRELTAPMGDGGPASAARLYGPQAAALASDGSLYFADTNNNRVRWVAPDGAISTVAGTGEPGYAGDGGLAAAATLRGPAGIAIDAGGNIFVSDTGNLCVRRIAPDGRITTVAANLSSPRGLAVDTGGNLYVAEGTGNRVRRLAPGGMLSTFAGSGQAGYAGDGGPAASASLRSPVAVATDAAGNVYVSDTGNYRIRRVAPDGTISTFAGNGIAESDSIYALNRSMGDVYGLAVDAAGNLWFADTTRSLAGCVLPDGTVAIVAGGAGSGFSGDTGAAWNAQLNAPYGLAAGPNGKVYMLDSGNNRIRLLEPMAP